MAGHKGLQRPAPAAAQGIRQWFGRLLGRMARTHSARKPRRLGIRDLLARTRRRRDRGDVRGAITDYREAVEDRSDEIPVGSRASVYLGWVQLLEKVNLAEALRTYLWLADEWQRDGRPRLAIGALRRVIALRPGNPEAYLRLARFLEDEGQIADAVGVYDDAARALRARGRTLEADALHQYIATLRAAAGRKSA